MRRFSHLKNIQFSDKQHNCLTNNTNGRQTIQLAEKQYNWKTNRTLSLETKKKFSIPRSARLRLLALKNKMDNAQNGYCSVEITGKI